jgi:putrescine aminotransferase
MDADALYADVVGKYSRHINPYLSKLMAFAGFGVEVKGEGCYLYDHEGRRFLDCLGGYGTFSLGHRHPKVVEAVRNQLDHIALSGKAFFSKNAADLAEKIAEVTPDGLEYTFFNNSGTEAVEAALKFAKGMTGRERIVSTEGSYHGKTLGALAVTGREKYRAKFTPLMPGAAFVPFGDAEAAAAAIDDATAAMIIEPVQGEGGINVPPPGYMRALREACDRHGALLIADEVQSGLARTGKMFAVEHDGVVPDIMALAKALGGGVMPLGATVGTQAVFEAIYSTNPLHHTSTFGGNPLACAAGLAGLNVIQDEGLVQRSAEMGALLKASLQEVADRHPDMVKEVRGIGLMIGVEMQEDEVGELIVAQLLKRGVCVAYALNNPRVLRFEPPLIITAEQVQEAANAFAEGVAETEDLLASLV